MNNKNYQLIFDKVILKQLKKAGKNNSLKRLLSKILNKIEENKCNLMIRQRLLRLINQDYYKLYNRNVARW